MSHFHEMRGYELCEKFSVFPYQRIPPILAKKIPVVSQTILKLQLCSDTERNLSPPTIYRIVLFVTFLTAILFEISPLVQFISMHC